MALAWATAAEIEPNPIQVGSKWARVGGLMAEVKEAREQKGGGIPRNSRN